MNIRREENLLWRIHLSEPHLVRVQSGPCHPADLPLFSLESHSPTTGAPVSSSAPSCPRVPRTHVVHMQERAQWSGAPKRMPGSCRGHPDTTLSPCPAPTQESTQGQLPRPQPSESVARVNGFLPGPNLFRPFSEPTKPQNSAQRKCLVGVSQGLTDPPPLLSPREHLNPRWEH